MQTSDNRNLSAELSLILGTIIALVGVTALIYSANSGRLFTLILAAALFTTSLIFMRLALILRRSQRYFFVSIFLLFSAFFLALQLFGFLNAPIIKLWPLLVINVGISFFSAGIFTWRKIRFSFLIPSVAFLLMGLLFLLFSLGLVGFSFKAFFLQWWPVLLIACGFLLLIASLSERQK